jgi:putative restriction endonuclease
LPKVHLVGDASSVVPDDPDLAIRQAAFDHLQQLVDLHGPILPWSLLQQGYLFRGERVLMGSTPRGIHRPKQMAGGALSIKTTVPKPGREARYDDQIASEDGHFVYKFQGKSPGSRDNLWLAEARRLQAPLVYFYGVEPGLYRPLWPVFITGWNEAMLECFISVSEIGAGVTDEDDDLMALRRRYQTVEAKKRLHQESFRHMVLRAYKTRCAVCNLPRAELLEAAHILPDRDVRGRPEVPNGLALCRLHHGVYDRNLLGIRPDHVIEIAPQLMEENDGPVLEQAIKGFDKQKISVPRRSTLRPRSEFLEERYLEFLEVG